MNDKRQWSVQQLRIRWRQLSIECFNYDAPVDAHWNDMMDEKLEIEEELELRGYKYSLDKNSWYDTEG